MLCTSCGQENPAGFRFCGSCGTPLEEATPAREVRKVVTIVFCDLTGASADWILGRHEASHDAALVVSANDAIERALEVLGKARARLKSEK